MRAPSLRRLLVMGIVCLLPALAARPARAEVDPAVVEAGRRATAYVLAETEKGGATGTAFCVDSSGLFITNHHVVYHDGKLAKVSLVLAPGTKAERKLPATVVKANANLDVALLRVDRPGLLDTVELAPPAAVARVRETMDVMALGFPKGQRLAVGAKPPEVTVSTGRVTALRRNKEGETIVIQFDGSINPGNSGGPLLDDRGQVIGVVFAILLDARQINLAVPVSFVWYLLESANVVLTPPALRDPAVAAQVVEALLRPPPAGRAAVPAEADRKEAQRLVRELYAARYADKSAKARQLLGLDLLERGLATTDDPSGRYGMLAEARDLAVAAGDPTAAFAATAALVDFYTHSPIETLTEVFTQVAPKATKPQDAAMAAAFGLVLAETATQRRLYPEARRLVAATRPLVAATRNPAAIASARDRMTKIEAEAAEYDRAKVAAEKLKADRDDPEANLVIGRFWCLTRGEFGAGLPMLAKGTDPALKAAAAADLLKPTTPAGQRAAGDLWWDLAAREARSPAAAANCKARAGYWYRLAEPQFTGLAKLALQRRLAELPPPPSPAPAAAPTAVAATPGVPKATTAPAGGGGAESALSRQLNDLEQWKVAGGTWSKVDGKIRGEGDAKIDFGSKLPADCVVSFRMNVVSGMRPRVHFGGADVTFGNEGYSRNLFPHNATDVQGEAFAYENGAEHQYTIRFAGPKFTIDIDGRRAFAGTRKEAESMRLSVRAGDGWSRGTTDFWDFRVEPPAAAVRPVRSDLVGGRGGGAFEETSPGGGLLVGLVCTTTGDGKLVNRIQPVFLAADGRQVDGKPRGTHGGTDVRVVAKDGYAVGGLLVRAGDRIDGLAVVFMRRVGDRLDPKDTYTSDWVGGTGGGVRQLGGDGKPVIGLFGGSGHWVDGVGVIQAQ